MYHGTDIDGRTLVFIRRTRFSFEVVESGLLSHDGESVLLSKDGGERPLKETEMAQILNVTAENRIAACRGFDLFVIVQD
jgi:hypothetical protein